jgi:hypothetical protein
MATAIQARDWAPATLRGIGNSLYTPFCGDDGDDSADHESVAAAASPWYCSMRRSAACLRW